MKRKPRRPNRKRKVYKKTKSFRSDVIHLKNPAFYTSEFQIISDDQIARHGGIAFYLNSMLNFDHYREGYDQYRINAVNIKFTPITTQILKQGNQPAPYLYTCIDRDDASGAFTSVDYIKGFANHKRTLATNPVSWTIKPNTLTPVFRGATSPDGYKINMKREWLDCTYFDVPHYGLKYWLEPGTINDFTYNVTFTYYISFRGRKL